MRESNSRMSAWKADALQCTNGAKTKCSWVESNNRLPVYQTGSLRPLSYTSEIGGRGIEPLLLMYKISASIPIGQPPESNS